MGNATSTPFVCSADQWMELAREGLVHWGIRDCEPEQLKIRENAIFRVRTRSGATAALRIHRLGYHSDAALRSEHRWTNFLGRNGIAVPRVLPTDAGDSLIHVGPPNSQARWQVDLLTWLDGRPLGRNGVALTMSPRELAEIFGALGRTIARMHDVTEQWVSPGSFERHAWDFDGFLSAQPIWGVFEDSPFLDGDQRADIRRAREAAVAALSRYELSPRNFGMIHADLVRENVLLGDNGIQILDFDDAGLGWHIYDLAVALYQNREEPDYPLIERALLDGYRSERLLTDADLATLPLFTALRAFALLGWISTRADSDTVQEAGPHIAGKAWALARDFMTSIQ